MHRTTIMLPEELKIKAEKVSRIKGLSLGKLVREALENFLDNIEKDVKDSLIADSAVYHGPAPADLSEHHNDYLYGGKN